MTISFIRKLDYHFPYSYSHILKKKIMYQGPSSLKGTNLDWLDSSNNVYRTATHFDNFMRYIFPSIPRRTIGTLRRTYMKINHPLVTNTKNSAGIINIRTFIDRVIMAYMSKHDVVIVDDVVISTAQLNTFGGDRILTPLRAQTIRWYVSTSISDNRMLSSIRDAQSKIPDDLEDGVKCFVCDDTLGPYVTAITCEDQQKLLETGSTLQHAICQSCLVMTMSNVHRTSSKLVDPTRPECVYDGCSSVYSGSTINTYVPQLLLHELTLVYAEKRLLSVSGRHTRCPDCSTLYDVTDDTRNRVTCTSCSLVFCSACSLKEHLDIESCTGAGSSTVMPDQLIRPCPWCNASCLKDDQCAHVKCQACSHKWNFCCGTAGNGCGAYICRFMHLPPYNVDLMMLWKELGYTNPATRQGNVDGVGVNAQNIELLNTYFRVHTYEVPAYMDKIHDNTNIRKDQLIDTRYFYSHRYRLT
jgi:hypothetical protein